MANKFHDFDEPINRIGTDSFKWDYEGENGKYIPLGVADTDFKAPEEAIAAVRKRTEFGVYAYGALPQERFAASICNWYKKRYGLTVDPETIRHSQGLMTGALWMILNAYTRPGDKVLIQAPVYHTFSIVIKGAGRFVESNDLVLEDGRYEMNFEDAKTWYDGYRLIAHRQTGNECYSMYSPKSVVEAMLRHKFGTYWNQTETYEALKIYIQMDMDGLKDSVVRMLAGESVPINIGTFSNDMTTFATKDDVLTLLVHLGYLTYDSVDGTVNIPNKEVSREYVNAISTMNWHGVAESVESSRKLLEALWDMDADAVATGIEKAHEEISILQYNDENSLSCTIQLAFYFAREYYTIVRELPAGKGFADVCMIPRKKYPDKPAVVIELKWDKSAGGAIEQIKEKQYGNALKEYQGNLLLVGINYNKMTKKHECVIEIMQK